MAWPPFPETRKSEKHDFPPLRSEDWGVREIHDAVKGAVFLSWPFQRSMVGGSLSELLNELEDIARQDAAGRGLTGPSADDKAKLLVPIGQLAGAAQHLCESRDVVVVTGFYIPGGEVAAAETDGPLGAVMLADALQRIGARVTFLTDRHCLNGVRVAATSAGFNDDSIQSVPDAVMDAWIEEFLAGRPSLQSLISIERVGPSHTLQSIEASACQPDVLQRFRRLVPAESRNVPHNMRGEPLLANTADLHRLFEWGNAKCPSIRTVGIGDGGNEIGMGTIPWDALVKRLGENPGAVVPCRIETDWNIIAGTSNWGGQALAVAVCALAGKVGWLDEWPPARQLGVLNKMVALGPCVDGVTRKRESTVDGLTFERFVQTWSEMVNLVKSRSECSS